MTTQQRVFELYCGLWGAAADVEGTDYWRANVEQGQFAYPEVVRSFFDQPRVQAKYRDDSGQPLTGDALLSALYVKIFKVANPDADGLSYWRERVAALNITDYHSAQIGTLVMEMLDGMWDNPAAASTQQLYNNWLSANTYFYDAQRDDHLPPFSQLDLNQKALFLETAEALVIHIDETTTEAEIIQRVEDGVQMINSPATALELTTATDTISPTAPPPTQTSAYDDHLFAPLGTLNQTDHIDGGDGRDVLMVHFNNDFNGLQRGFLHNIEVVKLYNDSAAEISVDVTNMRDVTTYELHATTAPIHLHQLDPATPSIIRVFDQQRGSLILDYVAGSTSGRDDQQHLVLRHLGYDITTAESSSRVNCHVSGIETLVVEVRGQNTVQFDTPDTHTITISGQGTFDLKGLTPVTTTIDASPTQGDLILDLTTAQGVNVTAGAGDDRLLGSPGLDHLNGGAGNDTLIAGRGDDVLIGGADADVFALINVQDHAQLTIYDWGLGGDVVTGAPLPATASLTAIRRAAVTAEQQAGLVNLGANGATIQSRSLESTPLAWSYAGKTSGEYRNPQAFAALTADGSVVTWGHNSWGGDSSAVQDELVNVEQIFSNSYAFAALKTDGSVVTWGGDDSGGNSNRVDFNGVDNNLNVLQIFSTVNAFAALRDDGSVITWGSDWAGGDSSAVQEQLVNVEQIFSNWDAFAALKADGSVVTWGDSSGGDSRTVQDQLVNIEQIFSNQYAFAALTADSSVVTWGDDSWGGNSSAVQEQLVNVEQIFSTEQAFAALKADGSVMTWGSDSNGGDSSAVQEQLVNVEQIFSADTAFAALKADGSVVTWGNYSSGGDSSAVRAQLVNVEQIFSTDSAFAALKADGSVVTWGGSYYGGDSSTVQDQLVNVEHIFSNSRAFAALKADGSVVTWGSILYDEYNYNYGGDSSAVQEQLVNVIHFADPSTDDRLMVDDLTQLTPDAITLTETGLITTEDGWL
jgi:alpha-tubulin suppressor-like RCC1 family protein